MSTPTTRFAELSAYTPSINPPLPPPSPPPHIAAFKPSIPVIVAALTTMFSLTFLLLLYAKHCKRENGNTYGGGGSRVPPLTAANKRNSGVDRNVINLLPVFRFGALQGEKKDGLECAVCLNRFEPEEVLRLLPKCKHAFHVECVDTWLDAHSTCPLCRYRVDPEDILLVGEPPPPAPETVDDSRRRISGRHSSAGERKLFLHRSSQDLSSSSVNPNRYRRSLDSWSTAVREKRRKLLESVSVTVNVGCFDREQQRKDGLLLTGELENERRRLEHRIIIGGGGGGLPKRWSEVQGSDLVLLRTEMMMNENNHRRWSSSSGSMAAVVQNWKWNRKGNSNNGGRREIGIEDDGRSVINGRTVSEITGVSREREVFVSGPVGSVGPVSKWIGFNLRSNSQS